MYPFHATNTWLPAELEQILTVWLNCLDQEESPEPGTESHVPSERDTNLHENTALPHDGELARCLCYCLAADTLLATTIRKDLAANIGKEMQKKCWPSSDIRLLNKMK